MVSPSIPVRIEPGQVHALGVPARLLRRERNVIPDFDWTATAIDALRRLWAEGHATAEIGRRLRCTKNAVIGKARRLCLPPRSSPIRRGAPSAEVHARTRHAQTTPRPPSSLANPSPPRRPAPQQPSRAPGPLEERTARRLMRHRQLRECCWPIGEPCRPNFRFCGATTQSGHSYCEAHAARAYVRVRVRDHRGAIPASNETITSLLQRARG